MQKTSTWISFVIIHVAFIGVWGALIEIPEKNGFPPTLGYVVWALTMIPAAMIALLNNKWKLDSDNRSVLLGSLAGLLAAVPLFSWGTQGFVMRFAIKTMKAESIFFYMALTSVLLIPVAPMTTALSPVITVVLSLAIYSVIPHLLTIIGMLLAIFAALMMGMEEQVTSKI